MAIADGLPSVGHVVQRAITIHGPVVSVSNTVGFYGIAPANATIVVYESGNPTGIVTTTASADGHWSATATLPNGTHTITAKAVEPNQYSDPIVVIVDPTAVSIGGSSGTVGGVTHESGVSGENHFQVVSDVQPITITVEILNNPCTVTMSFMGQTITVTAGNTPSPQTTFTAVFTDYDWSWGTYQVIVTAVSCGGTSISQPVAEVTLIDPSGYVYDAVTGEKIQGATATCYYSDPVEGQWVVWEAALYNNQLNPQLTDAVGWYGFMVPPGDYYVTASKEGYEDNQTIVYTIPPEVTDAHIALTPLAGYPTAMTVTAEPDIISVGGATSTLTAAVVDRFGDPVLDGTVVTFTTDLGSVGSIVVTQTTASGVATATLISGDVAGTATVTARAGTAFDTTAVEFTPLPCAHPLTGIGISGLAAGTIDFAYPFTATVTPPNASTPITYVWQATNQIPVTQTGAFTQSVIPFTWTTDGVKVITATAMNCGATFSTTHPIVVQGPSWYIYLPVVLRKSP